MGEHAAITLSSRVADRFGSYDVHGSFATIPQGIIDVDTRTELAAIVRPIPRLQVGFTFPFVWNIRRSGSDVLTGGGLGDLALHGRFDIIPQSTASALPAIALTTAVTFPTGRSAMNASNALGADVTGLGVAELRPGVFLEHVFAGRASAIVAASIGFRSASNEPPTPPFQLAPRLRLVAAGGPIFDMGLSLSLGVIHEREAAPTIEQTTAPDADRHRTALLGFVGYDVSSHYTMLASFEVDIPLHHMGQNEPAYAAISFGLRRAFPSEN